MMKFIVLSVCVLGLVAAVNAQKWSSTGQKASIMLGLDFPDSNHGYITAANEILTTTDGGNTYNLDPVPQEDLIMMTVAFNGSTTGVASGLSLVYTAQCYTDDGTTWTAADDHKYQVDAVQSIAQIQGTQGFCATGTFNSLNGVACTANGLEYDKFDWGFSDPASLARYGAFPSATTWYVAGGTWPETPSMMFYNDEGVYTRDQVHSVSMNVHMVKKTGKPCITVPNTRGPANRNLLQDQNNTFIATIQKTTDGGQTWTNVYSDYGTNYFNQISCTGENSCWAVAEGDVGASIYQTKDGSTWTAVMTAPAGESLIAIEMIDSTHGYAAGAFLKSQVQIEGHVYATTDGNTWTLQPAVNGYYFQDMSWLSSSSAYATAITVEQIGELLQYA